MKNILAENMIRFKTKNLSDQLKYILSEQVSQQVTSGNSADAYGPSDPNFKLLGKTPLPTRISSVQKKDPAGSAKIESELKSIPGYNDFITHLSNEKNGNSAIIWFLKLTQDSRKQFLQQFVQQQATLDKKLEYSVLLEKGKVSTTTTGIPITVIPPFSVGINRSGNDVFIDNKSDITSAIQAGIDELIADVQIQLAALEGSDVKLQVKSFTIGASASRFRNTNEAANLTWAQLSSERAKNVTVEVQRRLTELGVVFPPGIITVKGGFNGDGTSGPNPGFTPDGKPYTISVDGTFNNIISNPTTQQRNQFGKPLSTKPEYDQYKWLVVDCVIEAVQKQEPQPSQDIKMIGEYSMLIKQFKKPGTFKFPLKSMKKTESLRTGGKAKQGKITNTQCPDFTPKGVDDWWNRLGEQ